MIERLCPNGVEFKTLGSVCKVLNGYAFKSALFNSDGDGLPLIRIRDINTGFSDTYYSGDYDQRYIVEDGDVLIGMDGDWRATRWKHGRALLNQRVCRLEDFGDDMLPDFMYYEVQDELDRIHSGTQGSTVKHLSSRELERARIPVPPLEVQREIVRVLDTFQALEAELETELEARRRQYAFYWRAFLTPGDGWRRTTLGAIASVFDGPHATPTKTDSGPWYLSISSLTNGRFDLAESAHIGADQYDIWIRRVAPRVGDTMFSYETRLGQAAYWDRDEPAALGRRMGLLRPRESEVSIQACDWSGGLRGHPGIPGQGVA
jgi:type I restriction enzyme, S subunit